jgi:septum formation protein
MRLILASSSPRRRDLLRAAGLTFEVEPVDVDERRLQGESPDKYVRRMAAEKSALAAAAHAVNRHGDTVILGADTAVVVEGEILGKPASDEDARRMLERLSGRAHDVMTGLSLRQGAREMGHVETTSVWFLPLSGPEIDWYVGTGEGHDKAGGYAIQGLAARFIPRIEGSYPNVVGLPVHAVFSLMAQLGERSPMVASGE